MKMKISKWNKNSIKSSITYQVIVRNIFFFLSENDNDYRKFYTWSVDLKGSYIDADSKWNTNYTKFVWLTTNLYKLKQIYISNNLMNVKRCLKTSIFRAILQKQGIIDIFLSPPKYWPLLKRTLKYRTHHFPSCNKMSMRIISRMIMTTMIMTTRMNRFVFCLDARVSATATHLLT